MANTRSTTDRTPIQETTIVELTGRQQEIWQFLVDYVDRLGYPPTVREIGEAVGLASPSTVHAHLANLERAGLLRRDPTKPRALELIGREQPRARPRRCRSCRCSGRSPPAGRSSPSRTSRTSSPCPRPCAATSCCA